MRIDKLDLIAFGPFTNRTLDFSQGAQGLHLVCGPNEAGKSSALRAIQQFFASIPHRSSDTFIHKELRIGMTLRDDTGGAPHALVRRKGSKNTLFKPDLTPVDEAVIARLLGGLPVDEFLRKSVIDHAELLAGGEAIVRGKSDLGETLFSAGSAFVGVKDVLKTLYDDAENLYKHKGTNPAINAALACLKEKRDRVKACSLRSSDWDETSRQHAAAERRKEELRRAREDAHREQTRLERLKEAIEPARERAQLVADLAELPHVPRLRPNFRDERHEAQSALATNAYAVTSLSSRIETCRDESRRLDVPDELLDEGDAVEELYARRASQHAAHAASLQDERALEDLHVDARKCLIAMDRDPALLDDGRDAPALEALRRAVVMIRPSVQELQTTQRAVTQARAQAEEALDSLDAKLTATREKLAAIAPARETSALKKAIDKAKKLGEPEHDRDDRRRKLARDEKSAAKDLKCLEHWSGTLEDLEALAFPSVETIEAFRVELGQAQADVSALRDTLRTLDDQARETAAALERLRLGGAVPTEAELSEARRQRDELWRRFSASRTWDDVRAADLERAWRLADDLADRLRHQAERVAQHQQLVFDSQHQRSHRSDLDTKIAQAATTLDDAQARWNSLWTPRGISAPDSPAAMRGWLDRQSKLAEKARALADARHDLTRLDEQIDAQRSALSNALLALGEPAADAGESLADLLEHAEAAVESSRLHAIERKKLSDKIETLELDRPALQAKRDSARAERDDWIARCAALMRGLDLPDDAEPAVAASMLDQSKLLFDHLDRARGLRAKLAAAHAERDRFEADVRALAARLNPHFVSDASFEPDDFVLDLHRRLQAARQAAIQRDNLHADLRDSERQLSDTRAHAAENQRVLDALCLEAGCQDAADLPAIEALATRRDHEEAVLRKLDKELERLARASPLDEFLSLVSHADPDDLDEQLSRQAEQIAGHDRELSACMEQTAALNEQLKRMNGNTDAADLGQEIADLEAKIQHDAEQYAVLRLASAVLDAGIERYRQKVQGPVLDRASEFFQRFTGGSFSKLETDYHKDELVLVGTRADGSKIPVAFMSLGTADQLYLALRLAALEVDLAYRAPLPLVIDDVLIQFDDARATATLAVLAELSRRTQVLVFTHHSHLKELASSVVPAADLFFHDLPDSQSIPSNLIVGEVPAARPARRTR